VASENYPPGTQVERVDELTQTLLANTVLDIPLAIDGDPLSPDSPYMILFNNGTTALVPLSGMYSIIP
jgi:hypothetical protein